MHLLARAAAVAALLLAFTGHLVAAGFAPYAAPDFKAAVESGKPVVAHVHARWCPTCRRQQPILDALLAKPRYEALTAVRVDFDSDTDFRRAHRVGYQSTILVFKDGKEVARSTGVTDAEGLEALVARAL